MQNTHDTPTVLHSSNAGQITVALTLETTSTSDINSALNDANTTGILNENQTILEVGGSNNPKSQPDVDTSDKVPLAENIKKQLPDHNIWSSAAASAVVMKLSQKEQLNNQSTDCDDMQQFKNSTAAATLSKVNQIDHSKSEETKEQHDSNSDIQKSQSSSPSCTSSDEDNHQNQIKESKAQKIQTKNNHDQTDCPNDKKPEENKQSGDEQEEDDEEDEDEDEEEDLEDDHSYDATAVVEVSPKGRFRRFAEELGRGAYKIVFKGVDNETGREIAWNVINLKRLPKQDRIRIKSEIDLIKKLEHKNIIHFISAWFNKEKEEVVFITEMITGGSLRKYVKKIKNPRLKVIKGWCQEILQGLVYLHDQKPHPIIHRDLKCDNIFINSNSGEIRIGDLGLSTPMQNSFTTSVLGTPEFMAPELYEECYGTGVDIYAFGMCVLEMITLERPYKECNNPAQIYNKVIQGIRPKALDRIEDEEIKEFILWCLNRAENRPSAKELLESKFLTGIESEKNNREVKVKPLNKKKKPKKKTSLYKFKKAASTILEEEEEENSETEAKVKAANYALEQQKNEQSQSKSQSKVSTEIAATKGASVTSNHSAVAPSGSKTSLASVHSKNKSQEQHKSPSDKENQIDNEQKQQVSPQVTQVNIQSASSQLQIDNLKPSDESHGQIVELKRRKSSSKKKKLNESVYFLNQIDEQKQKKLQEKTMIGFNKDDEEEKRKDLYGTGENNKRQPEENILAELIRQTQLEDEQRLLQKQSSNDEKTENTNNMSPDQPIIKSQISSETREAGYSSLDLVSNLNSGTLEQKRKDSNIAVVKKFKEDQNQSINKVNQAINKIQSNRQYQQHKSGLSGNEKNQKATMSDDLRRKEGNHYSSHSDTQHQVQSTRGHQQRILSQQKDVVQMVQQQHQIQYYSQNSDNFSSNHKINQQQQVKSDDQNMFDNQSSSDQSDKNSESDQNIQIQNLKVQHEDHHQQKVTKQVPQVANTLPKPAQSSGIPKVSSSHQLVSQPNTPMASMLSPRANQKPTQTFGDKVINSTQQLQQQTQQAQTQMSKQAKPTTMKQQQPHPLPQQQPQTKAISNTAQNFGAQQQTQVTLSPETRKDIATKYSQHKDIQDQSLIVRNEIQFDNIISKNKVSMSFKIKSNDGGPDKEVTFEFDITRDTPQGVAIEMVKALKLNQSYIDVISKQIQGVVDKTKSTQQIELKQQYQQQPQISQQKPPLTNPASQSAAQQMQKKQSPSKISKETAIASFSKLYESIESFFQQMQGKGIETTDEIIEAMEGSNEEKQMRLEFLNSVYQAKRTLKKGIETYKNKLKKEMTTANIPIQKNLIVLPDPSPIIFQKMRKVQVSTYSDHNIIQRQNSGNIHHEESKNFHAAPKIQFTVPQYIRKNFKTAPSQFNCHSRLNRNLQRQDDVYGDEEIMALQNLLNIIFEVSIINLQKYPVQTDDIKLTIHHYLPLRIDGNFGIKTELSVQKFQKSLKLPMDGVVTDALWLQLLACVEGIIFEDKKEQQKSSQHQQQQQQKSLSSQSIVQQQFQQKTEKQRPKQHQSSQPLPLSSQSNQHHIPTKSPMKHHKMHERGVDSQTEQHISRQSYEVDQFEPGDNDGARYQL